MATEKRLIPESEKTNLIRCLKTLHDIDFTPGVYEHSVIGRAALFLEESVNAVEVVRCKDCVNYCGFEHCKNGICDVDSVSKRAVCPDDFCSYGERRNNEPEEPV